MKTFLAIVLSLGAATVFAQASLGTINGVEGLITVTDGAVGSTAASGTAITNGMRIVTTSGGKATLQLNNGCSVPLNPNQAVTVLQSMTCQELIGAVQPVGAPVAGAAGGFGKGLLAAGGLTLGSFGLYQVAIKSLSGN